MSWDTQSWAGKVKPGSASEKLVLLGLAQCSDANHCAHPSVEWICNFSDLDRKTVIGAIARLQEKDFIQDTGRRVGRTGKVKVYRLGAGRAADPETNNTESGTVPKTEQFQKRNSSAFSAKQSQKRDSEPVLEHNTPPSPPPGGSASDAKRDRGTRIAEDWQPPAIDSLPDTARGKARQWPGGAYHAEAEAFRDYWLAEGRAGARKLDWNRAWHNRINEVTARVLRDAKAGVKFIRPAAGSDPVAAPPPLDTSREGAAAKKIRDLIRQGLGQRVYDVWIAPGRLDVEGGTLTLVASSAFASTYQRDSFDHDIGRAMHAVLGPDAELRYHHERPPA